MLTLLLLAVLIIYVVHMLKQPGDNAVKTLYAQGQAAWTKATAGSSVTAIAPTTAVAATAPVTAL